MTGPSFSISTLHLALPWLAVAAGGTAVIHGLLFAPGSTWGNLLVGAFYALSLAVSAMFFLASQRLAGARWSAGLRRIPEALMLAMPLAAALLAALYLGRDQLFPWSRPGAFEGVPAIAGRVTYLRPAFVYARMAAALVAFLAFGWLFRRTSLAQDRDPASSLALHRRLNACSAAFVVVFAVFFTTSAYDWLLSLDPTWFSTMFAVYAFAGAVVHGIAAVTLAAVVLRGRGLLAVGEGQLHDLGKMLFAFSTFWAYLWVCQYLLIWYGNIPDEVTHYLTRTRGPWLPLFALNFVVNWLIPFAALLSARAKTNPRVLAAVSALVLCGRWLDLYLLVAPAVSPAPSLGVQEIAIAAGIGALLYLVFLRALSRASLTPVHDPVMAADLLEAPEHA